MTEIREVEQYKVVKSLVEGKFVFTVWEPADLESQYEIIQHFDRGMYGRVGTRLTSIDNPVQSLEHHSEQIKRADLTVREAFPEVSYLKLKVTKSGCFIS